MTRRLSARIAGFGHYAPERRVMNAELEERLGLEAGWIERRTGIKERRWAAHGEKLTDLAVKAGEMALSDASVGRDEVALTLLATSTPDHLLPPSAPLLAYRLGLTHSGAVDLAGACSGFLYALTLADGFVRTQGKAVLVVAANILSRRINPAERASAIVFADAAGAAVLVPSDDADIGIRGVDLVADGSQYGLINIPAGGSQQPFTAGMDPSLALMTMPDGKAVFTQAVRMMVRAARRALEDASTTAADIDRFIPHQANVRIFEAVREQLGLPAERTVQTIHDYGNSSAATIPLSLSLANQVRPLACGEQLLLTAAGAGMAGGAIVLRI